MSTAIDVGMKRDNMFKIYVKHLWGRRVVSIDGAAIGTLHNIIVDIETGQLIELVVNPDISVDFSRFQIKDKYILLPFECIKAIRDFIAIDKKAAFIDAQGIKDKPFIKNKL